MNMKTNEIIDLCYIDEKSTVCFTGHRQVDYKRLDKLDDEIRLSISQGYDTFLSGGAIGFDQYAALSVIRIKKFEYPHIRLIFILPCKKDVMSKKWNIRTREEFDILCQMADDIICLSDNYYDGCMKKRNEKLVELSSYCIAYMTKELSGTGQTVRLMKKKGGKTIFL